MVVFIIYHWFGALADERHNAVVFEEHPERRSDGCLTAEAVQGAALALERVDHVHGGHGLAAGVLGVGHRIADHVLQEHLEDTAGLFVDEAADALDATTACETADGGLGDALDVVPEHLAVALGAAFAQSFTSFTSAGHRESFVCVRK